MKGACCSALLLNTHLLPGLNRELARVGACLLTHKTHLKLATLRLLPL
jgi:hypothetical protein